MKLENFPRLQENSLHTESLVLTSESSPVPNAHRCVVRQQWRHQNAEGTFACMDVNSHDREK